MFSLKFSPSWVTPAVSIIIYFEFKKLISCFLISLVSPGISLTRASFLPTIELKRVDLPTLGFPIIVTLFFIVIQMLKDFLFL